MVGLAGLLMSWTTFDIGAEIKEVVREVGRENRAALASLAEAQKESQKETRDLMHKMSESQDRISKSQDDIARLLERVNSGA